MVLESIFEKIGEFIDSLWESIIGIGQSQTGWSSEAIVGIIIVLIIVWWLLKGRK